MFCNVSMPPNESCAQRIALLGARWLGVAGGRCLLTRFQCFEQEEDFGGHREVQIWGVGEDVVPATCDDGIRGRGWSEEPRWRLEPAKF